MMRVFMTIFAITSCLRLYAAPPDTPLTFVNHDPVNAKRLTDKTLSFVAGLKRLAQDSGKVLLVEGLPYNPGINPLSQEAYRSMSAQESIVAFAAAYDYAVMFNGNMAILRKRYSDARDLPSVTYEECKGAMDDIVRALTLTVPERELVSAFTETVIDSLSPEQRQQLENGGLAFSALSSEQKKLVDEWALGTLLDGPRGSAKASQFLFRPEQKSVFLLEQESPDSESRVSIEYTLPAPKPRAGVLSRVTATDGTLPRTTAIIEDYFVDTISAVAPTINIGNGYATTLGAIADEINNKRKAEKGTRLVVEAALIAKAALIIGDATKLSREEAARSIAFLYGLSLQKQENGNLLLKRHRWSKALTPADLPLLVQQTLPDCVIRAVNSKTLARRKEKLDKDSLQLLMSKNTQEEFIRKSKILNEQLREIESATLIKKTIAGVLLRDLLKTEMDEKKTSRLGVMAATPAARDLFGLVQILRFAHESKGRFDDAFADWLIKHDDFTLVGRVYDDVNANVQRADLSFSQTQENGRVFTPLKMGGGLYHPERKVSERKAE